DEERVVWPDAVVLGNIVQQRRGHFSLGFDGQILRNQLGCDLHHFHHAVLGGVLADQTISIHMHARREHAGLKEESGNAKGDKRKSGHGWHSSILVDIKKPPEDKVSGGFLTDQPLTGKSVAGLGGSAGAGAATA